MKILKRPDNIIYDTESTENFELYKGKTPELNQMVYQNTDLMELDFLKQYFDEAHQIFENFGQSYYYILCR